MINCQEIESFFATVSDFEAVVVSGENERKKSSSTQQALIKSLEKNLEALSKQKKLGSLSAEIEKVVDGIRKTVGEINQSTSYMDQRLRLQESYQDRLIILVFGKVNSGKSSFSNYFVDVFSKYPIEKQYFFFEDGEKKHTVDPFKVGSIETTARIQGVELGKLVLLDTPGLHSVTDKNGELTNRYTECADLILWLTGSNSPGQIQELDELKNELEKGKVLFPVITKSDKTDEDIEIQDGVEVLVSKLIMKPINDQIAQQDDVYQRTNKKLLGSGMDNALKVLRKPVSISTHYADQNKLQEGSGISELFSGLNGIYNVAIESKKENVRIQLKNQSCKVNKYLADNIEQPFKELEETLEKQKAKIIKQSDYITTNAIESVSYQLPQLIEKHSHNKNIKALIEAVNQILLDEVSKQLDHEFEKLFKSLLQAAKPPKNISIDLQSSFEDDTINYEYKSGSRKKAITSGVAGLGGAGLGFMMAGPIGGVIGGILGGLAGNKAGEYLIETETMTQIIGVDSSKVEAELIRELHKVIPKLVKDSIEASLNQFAPLEKVIKQSLEEIKQFNTVGVE